MSQSKFIADRLREVFLNGRWIANTNYKDQIESVNWQQATQQVGSLNTIALLTFHINYYVGGLLKVFQGGPLDIRDKYSFDMPPIASEADWKNLIDNFLSNAEAFAHQVEMMSDEKLQGPFIDPKYGTYIRNIEGIIEHGYYHLGQISLIKKMVLEAENA